MSLTIEQLKFAREIGATHIDTNEDPSRRINCFFRKDLDAYVAGKWSGELIWEGSKQLDDPSTDFERIDFTPLDDYYADKAVDIAATGGELEYDPADVAFKRPENERGAGMKYDSGKPRMSLIPPHALTEMAKVMTFGASKYKAHSWKQVENAQERYLDALLRHAVAYVSGERIDPESGLPTMAHIMCDAAFLIELDMFNDTKEQQENNE